MDLAILRGLVIKGVPKGVELLVVSRSGVLMLVFVNRFGVDTAAASSALLQIWVYIQMPALAIGMAVSTMAALNVGAQQFTRVRSIARVGAVYSTTLTGAMVAVAWLADSYLYQFFCRPDHPHWRSAVTSTGRSRGRSCSMASQSPCSAPCGAWRVTVPMAINVLTLVLRFVLAALLLERWQANAVWWSLEISMTLTVPLALFHDQSFLSSIAGLAGQSPDSGTAESAARTDVTT